MPASDSPDVLVARFLRDHGYHETFAAFLHETNLTPESISDDPTDLTIEKILEEKKLYDLALRFENINVNAGEVDFALPLSTASDKHLRIYSARAPYALISQSPALHAGPILSFLVISERWFITASMAGDIAISTITGRVVHRWDGHTKFVVKLAVSEPLPQENQDSGEEVRYVAAASYDKSLSVHKLHIPLSGPQGTTGSDTEDTKQPYLELLQYIKFPQTVEDVIFSKDYRESTSESSSSALLIVTIRDSAYLHVYSSTSPNTDDATSPFTFASKTPLNATSTWLTYTPTSLTPHPHQPHLLALITSSLPSPKLIVYNLETFTVDKEFGVPVSLSPYSTGIVAWRSDVGASGIWVNGDDGIIKGVEVKSGKVKVELKGHAGRKVRCLATGVVVRENSEGEGEEEVMISGGFDGGLKVWRVGEGLEE
ncbi:hypothetical protein ABW20_dc0104391 [Dactylellina cionopaga]|nr:hypothetical protein ABW20_dc0104391 [Dactylellina cionopaga]